MVRLYRRFFAAAQHDVEAIAERELGRCCFPIKCGHESIVRSLVRRAVENRIECQQRIAGEVHLRHQACRECGPEQRKMDVRGPPRVVLIAPRVSAGLDGDKAIAALGVAESAAKSGEIGIERRGVFVATVAIAAGRVCLPDLDQRMRNRPIVFVDHAAAHNDALAERFTLVLLG